MSFKSLLEKTPPIDRLKTELFGVHEVDILRLDKIDPEVSGNKHFKLKYNLETALSKGFRSILSFGGAFSNHILATAKACHLEGLKSIGMIRGEAQSANNPTLLAAQSYGMSLIFTDRETYRLRNDFDYQKQLRQTHNAYVIPEGGQNYLGINGAMEICQLWSKTYDHIFVAAGTGSTAAGLMIGARAKVHAISVLKGDFMRSDILSHLNQFFHDSDESKDILSFHEVVEDKHCGGYAKYDDDLINFMRQFYLETGIKLDPVYTGKMAKAAHEISQTWQPQKCLLIHTGGLQGIAGFEARHGFKLY